MRTLLFFDLPTETAEDRRSYNRFHKFLIKDGFMMLQYSVYIKLAVNKTVLVQIRNRIEKHKPPKGSIALLEITEKQFGDMVWILGEKRSDILDTTERLTIYDEV